MKAVNWNKQDDLTFMYWRQNIAQFWVDTEFKVSKDKKAGMKIKMIKSVMLTKKY